MRTNESTRRSAGRHALLLGIAAALTLGVLGTGAIAQSNEGPPRRWALTADEGGAARKVGAEPATTDEADADAEPGDPTKRYVPLPAAEGWNASLVIDSGKTGIWTVRAVPMLEAYGTPQIIGLDDDGRCKIMVGYSGKWSPIDVIHDGKWLGGLAFDDVDPRIEGRELYTGGQQGNLYMLVPYADGGVDARRIDRFEGREIHTLLSGDLDPSTDGNELLVFTRPGGLWRVTPTGEHGRFESTKIQDLPGRVRDAVVLGKNSAGFTEILTASRNGRLDILTFSGSSTPESRTVYRASMGLGRLARRPMREGEPDVIYATHDDGRILRFQVGGDAWKHETIYHGPQGPRGIAPGVFNSDKSVETVAVFGYSGRVELLERRADTWTVKTIFEDRDKGHWLAPAELDGRNATTELIGSGYGGRIFLLSRPPGYGHSDRAPATKVEK